jgi:hypothetical protein
MTEKRRTEHVVGDLSDFPEGSTEVVRVGRREIGVFNVGGGLYGLPNVCPHQTGPLCEGKPPLGHPDLAQGERLEVRVGARRRDRRLPLARPRVPYPYRRCLAFPNIILRSYEVFVDDGKVKLRL